MLIRRLPLTDLNPAPYNPRIKLQPGDPAWEKLERSLREFDLVQPIVWNQRTGHVVGGHQRIEVLRRRGDTEVDCVVDLPLEKEQALNVTLNNSSVAGDWDPEKLIDLVADLQALPDFDATLTGFNDQQLKDLVLAPAIPEGAATATTDVDDDSVIHVSLEIPTECWDLARNALDELLADEPTIRLHVRNRARSGRVTLLIY